MVLLDFVIGVQTQKLKVPSKFQVQTQINFPLSSAIHWKLHWCHLFLQPTRDDRGWFISPLGPNPWWTAIVACFPALLCTILIFMDQQITAVIINRKEHKLLVKNKQTKQDSSFFYRWLTLVILCLYSTERLWVPSGFVNGGRNAGGVLHYGFAMVCGSNRAVHLSCQQSEAGVRECSSWRAASLSGHQRAETHRPAYLSVDGLLCVHDQGSAGRSYKAHASHFTN